MSRVNNKKIELKTVSVRLDLDRDTYLDLMRQASEIFDIHSGWSFKNKSWGKQKAHGDLYADIRQKYPAVPSALVQNIRDTAMEACKRDKCRTQPSKKPYSGVRFDKRCVTLRGRQITIAGLGKRHKQVVHVAPVHEHIFDGWDFKCATLTYRRKKKEFWLQMTFANPNSVPQRQGQKTCGIDRGIYNLAVLSDGNKFSSSEIRKTRRKYAHTRKTLQQKGTRSAKRRLKAIGGREKRFMRDVNHAISKEIASKDYDIFVLEDLKGIRKKNRGRKMNKWLGTWAFHQFEQFLRYKAEAQGKQVCQTSARFTSQKCSQCGKVEKQNRDKSRYRCSCGFCGDADVNAAKNIRDNYVLFRSRLDAAQGPVNDPYGHVTSDSLTDATQAQSLVG